MTHWIPLAYLLIGAFWVMMAAPRRLRDVRVPEIRELEAQLLIMTGLLWLPWAVGAGVWALCGWLGRVALWAVSSALKDDGEGV